MIAQIRIIGLTLLLFGNCSLADEAPSLAKDPILEERVKSISLELRCLVCQNQTIADSNAGLAVDLKNQVRDMLREGMTEKQIKDFMVERYGDFVLYDPPIKGITMVLWAGPLLMLFVAFWFVVRVVRRRSGSFDTQQSSEDVDRARALLKD
ncbi:cytochrome c-type biogenesis protein CcmH [Burkholderiales bacterium]|nr:cytochrome c-type biogenesis protein CcmH [Burkholderiales bacterium]